MAHTTSAYNQRWNIFKFFEEDRATELIEVAEQLTRVEGYTTIGGRENPERKEELLKLNNTSETLHTNPLDAWISNNIGDLWDGDWSIFTCPALHQHSIYSVIEKGGYYRPHTDNWRLGHYSTTVFLSDPDSYTGGELQILVDGKLHEFKLKPGMGVTYATGIPVQIKEVTEGVRKAYQFWTISAIPDYKERAKFKKYYEQWLRCTGFKDQHCYPLNSDDIATTLEEYKAKPHAYYQEKCFDLQRKYLT